MKEEPEKNHALAQRTNINGRLHKQYLFVLFTLLFLLFLMVGRHKYTYKVSLSCTQERLLYCVCLILEVLACQTKKNIDQLTIPLPSFLGILKCPNIVYLSYMVDKLRTYKRLKMNFRRSFSFQAQQPQQTPLSDRNQTH